MVDNLTKLLNDNQKMASISRDNGAARISWSMFCLLLNRKKLGKLNVELHNFSMKPDGLSSVLLSVINQQTSCKTELK